ncbi:MAG TPA: hypothetical protein PKL44_00300 [Candidatus Dojkabacteria bacterium]|nr:hypothetical protein [Candidatus Dojkabacteria bacterium]
MKVYNTIGEIYSECGSFARQPGTIFRVEYFYQTSPAPHLTGKHKRISLCEEGEHGDTGWLILPEEFKRYILDGTLVIITKGE